VSKVPEETVIEPDDVSASPSVQVAVDVPVKPKKIAAMVLPDVVIENDPDAARTSRVPIWLHVVAAPMIKPPCMVIVAEPDIVPVNPVVFNVLQID
jgi:hypothetical protein